MLSFSDFFSFSQYHSAKLYGLFAQDLTRLMATGWTKNLKKKRNDQKMCKVQILNELSPEIENSKMKFYGLQEKLGSARNLLTTIRKNVAQRL